MKKWSFVFVGLRIVVEFTLGVLLPTYWLINFSGYSDVVFEAVFTQFAFMICYFGYKYQFLQYSILTTIVLYIHGWLKITYGSVPDVQALFEDQELYRYALLIGLYLLCSRNMVKNSVLINEFVNSKEQLLKECISLRQALQIRDETMRELQKRIANQDSIALRMQELGTSFLSHNENEILEVALRYYAKLMGAKQIGIYKRNSDNQWEILCGIDPLDVDKISNSKRVEYAYNNGGIYPPHGDLEPFEIQFCMGIYVEGAPYAVLAGNELVFSMLHLDAIRQAEVAKDWLGKALKNSESWKEANASAQWIENLECYNSKHLTQLTEQSIANASRYGVVFSQITICRNFNVQNTHKWNKVESALLRNCLRTGDVLIKDTDGYWIIHLPSTPLKGAAVTLKKVLIQLHELGVNISDLCVWRGQINYWCDDSKKIESSDVCLFSNE